MPTVLKRIRVEFQEQVKQGNGICTATTQEPEPSKLRLKRQEPLTRINTDHYSGTTAAITRKGPNTISYEL
jgi:hypothetical protein